jgi:hypothetical protein
MKGEERGGWTYIKLNNPNRIITVIMLPQIRLHSRDSNGCNRLDTTVLAKEPKRKVNIVNRAVHKDTPGELGIRHEEAAGIELVAGLRAEDGWCADVAVGHAPVGVAVGGVEAAGEAADYFLGWVVLLGFAVGVDYGLGLIMAFC